MTFGTTLVKYRTCILHAGCLVESTQHEFTE